MREPHEVETAGFDYGEAILAAITDSLKSEERRLKPRSEQELWPWSVSGYYEEWIRYLLFRELSDRFPKWRFNAEVESGGVPQLDLLIYGLAALELKGPHLIRKDFPKSLRIKIQEDFEKQRHRAGQERNLQHFVLLIVHAPKSEFDCGFVEEWLAKLESEVREEVPGTCIKLQPSEPLVLNGNDRLMKCCLYEVR